jgi:dTDP-4-amino-4,6-dideoxygalactose transaminase
MRILFNQPYHLQASDDAVRSALKSGVLLGGEFTKKVEASIAHYAGHHKVLLTDSCTGALEIAALVVAASLDYQTVGGEVIVPSYTFPTVASAFVKAGFHVRFADVLDETMVVDPAEIKRLLTNKTRAVVACHYGSNLAPVEELARICKENGVPLIEDFAQSFGATLNGKRAGLFGDLACTSFHQTKNIHCGLGGALICANQADFERASFIRDRGTNRGEVVSGRKAYYEWCELGGSYMPTEFQAAYLLPQLQEYQKVLQARQILHEEYVQGLSHLRAKARLDFRNIPDMVSPSYHAFFVVLNSEKTMLALRGWLGDNGIESYIGYFPLHLSKMGQRFHDRALPRTEDMARRLLRLPMHCGLSRRDVRDVCQTVSDFWNS